MSTSSLHPISSNNCTSSQGRKPKLLEQVRHRTRSLHYSIRTEDAYVDWIRRFVLFHGKQHPSCMGEQEVEAFLSHLAVEKKVAASTQNQAKSALLFLYREVLGIELPVAQWRDQRKAWRATAGGVNE